MENYLGVDIGGTAVKIGLATGEGKILCKQTYDVAFDGYKTPILETVLKSASAFLQSQQTDASCLKAIGVSATGQINTRTGTVVGSAGHIENYLGAEIAKGFEGLFGRPVTVLNDANSVALAEHWIGGAKGCSDVLVVTIGTGVGGGVITSGQLLGGKIGIAGELGHFMINNDGAACSCGNRGCYELYASMSALVRQVRAQLSDLPYSATAEEVNGKQIFAWFWAGDAQIVEIVDRWIGYIADGLIGLTHIFNPEIILLGGGVSNEGEAFLRLVRGKVFAGLMPRFAQDLRLEAATLGNDAGLIGAVRACQQ